MVCKHKKSLKTISDLSHGYDEPAILLGRSVVSGNNTIKLIIDSDFDSWCPECGSIRVIGRSSRKSWVKPGANVYCDGFKQDKIDFE